MRMKHIGIKYISVMVLAMGLMSCGQEDDDSYSPSFSDFATERSHVYTVGVHPLYNPERLAEIFGPLTDYLGDKIPNASFKIEASRSYAAYDQKLYAGKFDFALPNPYQTVLSFQHGYRVFGKMGDDDQFRGIILVRKDSGIKNVTDLKGKTVSFPAPTALAATMMPQYYLQTNGLDITKDIKVRYVGSQESSIMDVYLGNVAAAATWPPPWNLIVKQRPKLGAELYPIWQTSSLPNNAWVVRSDVPVELVDKVAQELFNLHDNVRGRKILAAMDLSKFEAAENKDYDPVLMFLEKFSTTVRKLE